MANSHISAITPTYYIYIPSRFQKINRASCAVFTSPCTTFPVIMPIRFAHLKNAPQLYTAIQKSTWWNDDCHSELSLS